MIVTTPEISSVRDITIYPGGVSVVLNAEHRIEIDFRTRTNRAFAIALADALVAAAQEVNGDHSQTE